MKCRQSTVKPYSRLQTMSDTASFRQSVEAFIATRGWTQSASRSLFDIALLHPDARHLLVTDIGRDGMLKGPNISLMQEVRRRLPDRALQASGGVTSLDDVSALWAIGAAGAIVGKALWEGAIDLAEAVQLASA